MLWLIAQRLYQEYFCSCMILIAMYSFIAFQTRKLEKIRKTTSKSEMRLESVYQIWKLEGAEPSSKTQELFTLPNQRCTIEILSDITSENNVVYTNLLNASKLEAGTRMFVICPEDPTIDNSDLFQDDDEAVQDFRRKCLQWIGLGERSDRGISIIVPTLKHGTMTLSPPEVQSNIDAMELLQISLVDSVYKNNETSRLAKFADAESETKAAANARRGGARQPLLGSKRRLLSKLQRRRRKWMILYHR